MEPTLVEQEPTLAELEAQWRGVLYAEPGTNLNGHAVGEFGWKGISVSRDKGKELLRVTLGGKKLGPTKKPFLMGLCPLNVTRTPRRSAVSRSLWLSNYPKGTHQCALAGAKRYPTTAALVGLLHSPLGHGTALECPHATN